MPEKHVCEELRELRDDWFSEDSRMAAVINRAIWVIEMQEEAIKILKTTNSDRMPVVERNRDRMPFYGPGKCGL